MMHYASLTEISGCTPGYANLEDKFDRASPEYQTSIVLTRSSVWGFGFEH